MCFIHPVKIPLRSASLLVNFIIFQKMDGKFKSKQGFQSRKDRIRNVTYVNVTPISPIRQLYLPILPYDVCNGEIYSCFEDSDLVRCTYRLGNSVSKNPE